MNYRRIGASDILVSEISLGCWTMGGLNWVDGRANGWANVNEDDVVDAVRTALDAGVNHFDNADVYGNGRSERMLARAFKKLGVPNSQVVIASKMGHFKGTAGHAYEPAHIRHQCEQSLINLNRDYLDIYYFHHGSFGPYLEEAAAAMDALVAAGMVRVKGQSAYSQADFATAVPVVKPAALQSWAHALDDSFVRADSPLQSLMAQYQCTFVAFSPLAQARLLDKFDPARPPVFEEGDNRFGSKSFAPESLAALRPKLARLKSRFGSTTGDLSAMALRYVLNHEHVACVIPGFRNATQVRCNLLACDRELTAEDMEFIRATLA